MQKMFCKIFSWLEEASHIDKAYVTILKKHTKTQLKQSVNVTINYWLLCDI
jgi:hypothetical protein